MRISDCGADVASSDLASGGGQRQVKADLQAAAVGIAPTEVAAAGVDDALGDRETKTVTAAGAIARLREAHERLEYRFDAILRNAGTAVLDLDHAVRAEFAQAHGHAAVIGRVAHGVADDIFNGAVQQRWLAAHIEFRYQFAVYGNAAGLGFEAGVLANRFKDFIEREDLGRKRRFALLARKSVV